MKTVNLMLRSQQKPTMAERSAAAKAAVVALVW